MDIISKTFNDTRNEFLDKVAKAETDKDKLYLSNNYINYLEKKVAINNYSSFFVSYEASVEKDGVEEKYDCNTQIDFSRIVLNENGIIVIDDNFYELLKEDLELDFDNEYTLKNIHIVSMSKI